MTIARRRLLRTALGATAFPIALHAAAPARVTIDNFSFMPASLTISAGTTVIWINRDDMPHSIVASDPAHAVKSPVLDTEDQFSFTFVEPGAVRYFCSLHPRMEGMVIVT